MESKKLSTDKSEKIFNKIKKLRYKSIFNKLLPDSNGVISKETVYKSDLSREILKVLRPLIEELEVLDESLDFEEFAEAMEILMKTISPAERSVLLQTSKTRAKPEVYAFKPKINENKRFSVSPTKVRSRLQD